MLPRKSSMSITRHHEIYSVLSNHKKRDYTKVLLTLATA